MQGGERHRLQQSAERRVSSFARVDFQLISFGAFRPLRGDFAQMRYIA